MNFNSLCLKAGPLLFTGKTFEVEALLDGPVAAAFRYIGCLAINSIAAGQENFKVRMHRLKSIKGHPAFSLLVKNGSNTRFRVL